MSQQKSRIRAVLGVTRVTRVARVVLGVTRVTRVARVSEWLLLREWLLW